MLATTNIATMAVNKLRALGEIGMQRVLHNTEIRRLRYSNDSKVVGQVEQ